MNPFFWEKCNFALFHQNWPQHKCKQFDFKFPCKATGLPLNCEFLPDPKCNEFMVSWASLKYVTKLCKSEFISNFLNIRPRGLKPIAYGKDIGIYRFYCFESPTSSFGKVTNKFTFFINQMCSQGRRLWSQRHVPKAELLIVRHREMFLKDQATLTNCTGAPMEHSWPPKGRLAGRQGVSLWMVCGNAWHKKCARYFELRYNKKCVALPRGLSLISFSFL